MRRTILGVIAIIAIVIGSSISNVVMADTSSGSENAIKAQPSSVESQPQSQRQSGSAIANSDGSRKVIATRTSKASRKSSARRTTKRTSSRVNVQNVIRAMGKNLKLNRTQIRQLQRDRQLQTMVRRFQRDLERSSRFQKLTSREQTTLRKNTARAQKSTVKHRTTRRGSAVKGAATSTRRNAKCTSKRSAASRTSLRAHSGKSTIAKRSRANSRTTKALRNRRS